MMVRDGRVLLAIDQRWDLALESIVNLCTAKYSIRRNTLRNPMSNPRPRFLVRQRQRLRLLR
jgi:hypothetical protein